MTGPQYGFESVGPGFRFESNANEVASALLAVGVRAGARTVAVTRTHGQLLETNIKRRVSLPRTMERWYSADGVRAITGDYRRSWNLRMEVTPVTVSASVGTNRPQARRLEYGFSGVDSLGRRYHQPPYPHARPALMEIEPLFLAGMARVVSFSEAGHV